MKIVAVWQRAPREVRWASLIWFLLGPILPGPGLDYLSLQLLLFLAGNSGPIAALVVALTLVSLGIAIAVLPMVAAWRLFFYASRKARLVLEVLSWIDLIYFGAVAALWIPSAVWQWTAFKAEAVSEFPQISPMFVFAIAVVIALLILGVNLFIIRALRSNAARTYVGAKQVEAS